MVESIIVALITGVLAVLGAYVGNMSISRRKERENALKDAEREATQSLRLKNIETKLDIHNGYAEKFGEIQKDIAVIKNDIQYLRKEQR